MNNPHLHNPHFNSQPFLLQGNEVGILLLHGLTATPFEVRGFGEDLHQLGYTVSGILLPGHGTSPDDLNRVTWHDWLNSVTEAYQQLKKTCQHVFIGGESTGGLLSLYLASQHPDIVGVLTYAPAIKLNLNFPDMVKLYVGSLFMPSVPKADIDTDSTWQGYPVNPLKGVIQLIRLQKATLKRMHLIQQPVLVVQGRHDTTTHPTCGEIILSKVQSRLKKHYWMDESSHVVLLNEESPRITELSLEFIREALDLAGVQ